MKCEIFTVKKRTRKQQESQAVGWILIHQLIRIGIIAERFGHFSAVVSGNNTCGYDIFERIFTEKSRVDSMNIVEPRTNLTDIFHDEIAREVLFEFFFIFERIMELRKRHRATFEPAVDNFVDSSIFFAVNFEGDFINPRSVIIFKLNARKFF